MIMPAIITIVIVAIPIVAVCVNPELRDAIKVFLGLE